MRPYVMHLIDPLQTPLDGEVSYYAGIRYSLTSSRLYAPGRLKTQHVVLSAPLFGLSVENVDEIVWNHTEYHTPRLGGQKLK